MHTVLGLQQHINQVVAANGQAGANKSVPPLGKLWLFKRAVVSQKKRWRYEILLSL